jgi:YidC/Oxa1 family membrane protein insertase
MFGYLYNTLIYYPLYNGLILLLSHFPWLDAGIAAILFTLIIRTILFPLSRKMVITQIKMREIQPELEQIKVQYKDDKQTQAAKTLETYKKHKINPFSGIFLTFIQLPVMYALNSVFIRSGLPVVNKAILYHFVAIPTINVYFLGLVDVTKASIVLSIGAAIAQYLQLEFSLRQMNKTAPVKKPGSAPSSADMTQNMTKQMKYIFPVIIFIVSYRLSAVLSLYWITTNLFTVAQEFYVRYRIRKEGESKVLKELEAEKF